MIIMKLTNLEIIENNDECKPSAAFAQLLLERAAYHIKNWWFDRAESLCIEALNILQRTCGRESREYLIGLMLLGAVYDRQGLHAISYKYVDEVLDIFSKIKITQDGGSR